METAARLWQIAKSYQNALLFICGFVFDLVTIKRIDSTLDLAYQFAYLVILTFLMIYQYREHHHLWAPAGFIARIWHYNIEVLHFIYGGLLSNYVILYFKSSSGARPIVFFLLLVALMFANEMPQIRRFGYRLRLGLYAFCLASFMIYFVPILAGRMGALWFLLSLSISTAIVWRLSLVLVAASEDKRQARARLFTPAGTVLAGIATLYFLRLIPPVPLSVQFQGIYHGVARDGDSFLLKATKPPFYRFWRRESRPFLARPGDQIYYFVRVFAPARFHATVNLKWEQFDERTNHYVACDKIPLAVTGGRDEGFRSYAVKSNFTPGRWRVGAETLDGQTIGFLSFVVDKDDSNDERKWISVRS
jgi:hypothetical protein